MPAWCDADGRVEAGFTGSGSSYRRETRRYHGRPVEAELSLFINGASRYGAVDVVWCRCEKRTMNVLTSTGVEE